MFNSDRLKASGNLSYLDFIRVLGKMWNDAYPNVPFRAEGDYTEPVYPMIEYGLLSRVPRPDEPKPRVRETVINPPGVDSTIIKGQWFENLIRFTVLSKHSPEEAEALIELFEDFMMEFTPVFKNLGVAQLFYGRRVIDADETRVGPAIVKRTVTFLVTIEKIVEQNVGKIKELTIQARIFLNESIPPATPDWIYQIDPATPPMQVTLEDQHATPSY